MRASLPMYDLAAVRAATDEWWAGLAKHLRGHGVTAVPNRLERPPPAWTAPDLLFSQTCGYPLTHALAGRVKVLLTPVHDAPGCRGIDYASVLIVGCASEAAQLADLRGGVCAVNAAESHSGNNVLRRMLAPLARDGAFFTRVIETGSHVASIERVAAGAADLCAVDCVTHALLADHAPNRLTGTRVLAFSPRAPGLPWIAGPGATAADVPRLRAGLAAALADPGLGPVRATLRIAGGVMPKHSTYARITAMERQAAAAGYPVVR